MPKALVINGEDNVATALTSIEAGSIVTLVNGDVVNKIKAKQAIPFCHKIAIANITKGGKIVKYGEVIGKASTDIEVGSLVHIHNVESLRGRGDLVNSK